MSDTQRDAESDIYFFSKKFSLKISPVSDESHGGSTSPRIPTASKQTRVAEEKPDHREPVRSKSLHTEQTGVHCACESAQVCFSCWNYNRRSSGAKSLSPSPPLALSRSLAIWLLFSCSFQPRPCWKQGNPVCGCGHRPLPEHKLIASKPQCLVFHLFFFFFTFQLSRTHSSSPPWGLMSTF